MRVILELEACSAIYPNGMILIGPMFPFTLPHALRISHANLRLPRLPEKGSPGFLRFLAATSTTKQCQQMPLRSDSEVHCDNSKARNPLQTIGSPSFVLIALNTKARVLPEDKT